MSEKETNTPEDDGFIKNAALRAGAISTILLAGVGGIAIGQNAQREQSHDIIQKNDTAQKASHETYNNSIEAAVNAQYDSNQVVGEINVTESANNLIDPAQAIVKTELGNDYEAAAARTYEPLLDSAKAQNPQPGEIYSVVSVDINPEQADGNEFIVVDQANIQPETVTALPSPIIEDGTAR
jgi:hypothetical protein